MYCNLVIQVLSRYLTFLICCYYRHCVSQHRTVNLIDNNWYLTLVFNLHFLNYKLHCASVSMFKVFFFFFLANYQRFFCPFFQIVSLFSLNLNACILRNLALCLICFENILVHFFTQGYFLACMLIIHFEFFYSVSCFDGFFLTPKIFFHNIFLLGSFF